MSSTYQVRCFYSVIKHGVSSSYIINQIYYKRQQILSVFINIIHILGIFMKILPPMTAIEVKCMSQIIHFDNIFSLAVVGFCFNANNISLLLCLKYIIRQMFLLDLLSIPPIFILQVFSRINLKRSQTWTW